MSPYRNRHSHSPSAFRVSGSTQLIAFLLVASFGILFAGCSAPPPDDSLEEFSFTADDVARFRELAEDAQGVESGTVLRGTGSVPLLIEGSEADAPVPVLDLSMVNQYETIRMGLGASDEDLYRVINPFLNVRAQPNVTAEAVGRLDQGDTATLIEFPDAAWAHIKMANGTEGYVAQRYIAKVTSEEKMQAEKKKYEGLYFVNFGFLNVRKEADAQSEKIAELPGQALVRPLSMDKVWARISYDGKDGYVAVQYLSPFLPNFLVRQDRYNLPVLHYQLEGGDELLASLARQVDLLRKQGNKIITLNDFYKLVLSQEEKDVRLDPRTVVLAISGITSENVREVSDVLFASNVSATLFLRTQDMGLSGITEKIILNLMANGNDLQSGGHTGDDLRSLTNAQVDLELAQSRKLLEQYTKKPVFAVGFPRGGINDRVRQKAAESGYLFGLTTAVEPSFTRAQFLNLPSLPIGGSTSEDEVLKFANGEAPTS